MTDRKCGDQNKYPFPFAWMKCYSQGHNKKEMIQTHIQIKDMILTYSRV